MGLGSEGSETRQAVDLKIGELYLYLRPNETVGRVGAEVSGHGVEDTVDRVVEVCGVRWAIYKRVKW